MWDKGRLITKSQQNYDKCALDKATYSLQIANHQSKIVTKPSEHRPFNNLDWIKMKLKCDQKKRKGTQKKKIFRLPSNEIRYQSSGLCFTKSDDI